MMVMTLACCAPRPPSMAPTNVSMPRVIAHATPDDCAIIAEIGKSQLHWSATKAPEASFYPEFAMPGGGTYMEDCPWKKLGIAEPRVGKPDTAMGFFISRPNYSTTGANAYFQYSVGPMTTPDGKRISPFIEQQLCTFEKNADGWHLVHCKMTAIT
jgi:hypothetical protein